MFLSRVSVRMSANIQSNSPSRNDHEPASGTFYTRVVVLDTALGKRACKCPRRRDVGLVNEDAPDGPARSVLTLTLVDVLSSIRARLS